MSDFQAGALIDEEALQAQTGIRGPVLHEILTRLCDLHSVREADMVECPSCATLVSDDVYETALADSLPLFCTDCDQQIANPEIARTKKFFLRESPTNGPGPPDALKTVDTDTQQIKLVAGWVPFTLALLAIAAMVIYEEKWSPKQGTRVLLSLAAALLVGASVGVLRGEAQAKWNIPLKWLGSASFNFAGGLALFLVTLLLLLLFYAEVNVH